MKAIAEFRAANAAYLCTTDVAGRGLDIPDTRIVLQADCPRDVRDFIHRAGRCTRMGRSGLCVLLLTESEWTFIDHLKAANIAVELR